MPNMFHSVLWFSVERIASDVFNVRRVGCIDWMHHFEESNVLRPIVDRHWYCRYQWLRLRIHGVRCGVRDVELVLFAIDQSACVRWHLRRQAGMLLAKHRWRWSLVLSGFCIWWNRPISGWAKKLNYLVAFGLFRKKKWSKQILNLTSGLSVFGSATFWMMGSGTSGFLTNT